ncbi:Putative ribonuclease H protein At1g65750 [Linum perenne]
MKMEWDLGVKQLCIQTDSTTDSTLTHQHFLLVLEFRELLSRHWDVKLTHVFREANQAADYMANLGHSFDFGFQFFHIPDSSLCNWLRYDLVGVAMPQAVLSNN